MHAFHLKKIKNTNELIKMHAFNADAYACSYHVASMLPLPYARLGGTDLVPYGTNARVHSKNACKIAL